MDIVSIQTLNGNFYLNYLLGFICNVNCLESIPAKLKFKYMYLMNSQEKMILLHYSKYGLFGMAWLDITFIEHLTSIPFIASFW